MNIPPYIGKAKTLFIAKLENSEETVYREVREIQITHIAVCQYDGTGGFYLFGCDEEFNAWTDFFYDDIEDALEDAKRLYQLEDINWIQPQ